MSSYTLILINGHVVTMDEQRKEYNPGYVAIKDDRIVDVGPMISVPAYGNARVLDVSGQAVLPGFVNAHAHTLDILLRGGPSDDRSLYDWLMNIVLPGFQVYSQQDVETAVKLFCLEGIRSGITTFVDNVEFPVDRWEETSHTMTSTYARTGMRAIYAHMFYDYTPPQVQLHMDTMAMREPGVNHDLGTIYDLEQALTSIERMIGRYHGSADGRVSVWPSPGVAVLCSREGLLGAKRLAAKTATRVTMHTAESFVDKLQEGISSIDYLHGIGFLGPEVLLGHCVQLETKDLRLLAATDTKVATNPVSNLYLGNGVARVSEMQQYGITVGLGTDDANCNGNVNMLADLKIMALAQKGAYRDAGAITAQRVLEMATIDGAKAVGMEHEIGSLEIGKKADLVTIPIKGPHLVPRHQIASVLVYQTLGHEPEHVVIDGDLVMEHRRPSWMSEEEEESFLLHAQATAERVIRMAGIAQQSRF